MNIISKINIAYYKSLVFTPILRSKEPKYKTDFVGKSSSILNLHSQLVLNNGIGSNNMAQKAGDILTRCENQQVFLPKILHIQYCKIQETPKNSSEKSCVYAKLIKQIFRNNILLTGN